MENSIATINQGRPVYFSYARNSSKKPEWEHISDCVEPLLKALTDNGIEYRVDIKDIGNGDKISKFEQEIGWNSELVVIIFSDKYFRSMHCMYEFVQIKRALEKYPTKRLMGIKCGDFNLADVSYIRELERYWNSQKIEYEDIEYHRLRELSETEKAAWQNGFYIEDIRKLYSFFSAINYSYAQSLDYESFTSQILMYYANSPKHKLTPKYEPKVVIQNPQPTKVDNVDNATAVTARQPYHDNKSYSFNPPPFVEVSPAQPYHVSRSYSQQQYNLSLTKWVVLALVIPLIFLIVALSYGTWRLGFWGILAFFLPAETFVWYKICKLWIERTTSTNLKTVLTIFQWVVVIVFSVFELFLLPEIHWLYDGI